VAAGFEPDLAFLTRDVLAIGALVSAGLVVILTPRLIADRLDGVRMRELCDDPPRRSVFALTPRTGTSALARAFLESLRAT
jgi:DNA-binding transcriptional LysR family regulator